MEPLLWKTGYELGQDLKEVDAYIQLWLRSNLLDYEFVQLDTFISDPNHRWRATSALQKAIRRGNVETALRMANGLHGLDWEVVWRRMAVIALEEIGVADIELVAATVWVSGKRQWRMANGGCLQYLYMIVEKMARGVKDRSVCDLVCWADWCPDLAAMRLECFDPQLLTETLVMTYLDHDAFLARRMLSAWALVGTKRFPGENIGPDIEGSASWGVMMSAYVGAGPVPLPPAVQLIANMASNKTGDAMPIAFPLVYEMAHKTWQEGIMLNTAGLGWEPDDLVKLPMLGNYPSEAFDQFVREGKRAIRYFNKCCPPAAQFLTEQCGLAEADSAGRFKVTSILVFRVEGAQVDRRLVFDGSRDLLGLAEMALNRSQGCPGEFNDFGMELIRANMPLLHHARKVVLDMIPQGSIVYKPNAVSVALPSNAPPADEKWSGLFDALDALDEPPVLTDVQLPVLKPIDPKTWQPQTVETLTIALEPIGKAMAAVVSDIGAKLGLQSTAKPPEKSMKIKLKKKDI